MCRVGVLFVDLNTTDRVLDRAEVIQLAATELTGNAPGYSEYAIPSGRIHPCSIPYHGITESDGILYYEDQPIVNPKLCERDLISDFADWINDNYDKVYLIHHSYWKRRVLNLRLEHNNLHINPHKVYVDIMKKMKYYKDELNLHKFSLGEIFLELEDNLSCRDQDAYRNAQGIKCCAINAASKLNMNVKDFLVSTIEHGGHEGH